MSRPSSVFKVPASIREELDRRILIERVDIESARLYLQDAGYTISKSSMGRYAKALRDGGDSREVLNVGGTPLAIAVAEIVATDSDPLLAELLQGLLTLQVQQVAVLKRLQAHVRDRRRADAARDMVRTERQGVLA